MSPIRSHARPTAPARARTHAIATLIPTRTLVPTRTLFPALTLIPTLTLALTTSAALAGDDPAPITVPGHTLIEIQADPGTPATTTPLVMTESGRIGGHFGANTWQAFTTDAAGTVQSHHPFPDTWLSEIGAMNDAGYAAVSLFIPPPGDGAYTSQVGRLNPDGSLQNLSAVIGGPVTPGQSIYGIDIDDDGRMAVQMWASAGGHTVWCWDDDTGWAHMGDEVEGASDMRLAGLTADGATIVVARTESSASIMRRDADATMTALWTTDTPFGVYTRDMNDAGHVVGNNRRDDGTWGAYRIRPDGTFQDIHDLLPDADTSAATLVSPSGVVAGTYWSKLREHGFVLDGDTLRTIPQPEHSIGMILGGVNDDGTVAGTMHSEIYEPLPFVADADGITMLQDLVDPAHAHYHLHFARAITPDGRILMDAVVAQEGPLERVALVLVPDPIDVCPTDLDGDGSIGFGDILAVLAGYGNGDAGDVDGDDDTDFDDLVSVLAAFGSTCS